MVARLVRNEKARGSNPLSSTRREPRPTSMNVAGRAGFVVAIGARPPRFVSPRVPRGVPTVQTGGRSGSRRSATAVRPRLRYVDMGHHDTSTSPGSPFTTGFVLGRHVPGRHVTVTHQSLTPRTPGRSAGPDRRGRRGAEVVEVEVGRRDRAVPIQVIAPRAMRGNGRCRAEGFVVPATNLEDVASPRPARSRRQQPPQRAPLR